MTPEEIKARLRQAQTRYERAYRALDIADLDKLTAEQIASLNEEFDAAKGELRTAEDAEAALRAGMQAGRTERTPDRVAEARANALVKPEHGGPGGLRVSHEAGPYERGKRSSYFMDLARVSLADKGHPTHGVDEARERLTAHEVDVREYVEAQERRADRQTSEALQQMLGELPKPLARQLEEYVLVEKRAMTRVDGAGGHFVPPTYLLDRYAENPRAGRPFVEACMPIELPSGTDSLNIPRITTGSLTGVQTADNAAVTAQDMVDAVATAPVRTIAGQVDIAIQALEQSPIAYDEIIFKDLIADYYFRTEDQAFNGTGSSGQVLGVLNTSGIGTTTYTDGTPTVPELWPKVAGALYAARTARKRGITHGWLAPGRSLWLTAALDSNNRPLIAPSYGGPQNALAGYTPPAGEEDPELILHGVRHRISDAIPTNLGAGTNEDRIVETRCADHAYFESGIRARALPEILSNTLGVRLQVYAYVAFTAGRFPAAVNVIAGTGLVAPTF